MSDPNVPDELQALGYTTEDYINEKEAYEERRRQKQRQLRNKYKIITNKEVKRITGLPTLLSVILDGYTRFRLSKDGDAYKIDVRKYMGTRPTKKGCVVDASKFAIGAECIMQKLIQEGIKWDTKTSSPTVDLHKSTNPNTFIDISE